MRYRIVLKHIFLAVLLAGFLAACSGGSSGDATWYARNTLYSYSGNQGNLWDQMRKNMHLNYYTYTPRVRRQIVWLQHHQTYLNHAIAESAPYIYYIYQQTQKRHLPAELALIPVIESEYNPYERSNVGAEGLWQMMPKTARGFGLKRDWWYNGSRDVIASTNAALEYFSYLHGYFNNNWLLAIAAYDCGEGAVSARIRFNKYHHRSTDYWNLPLPIETQLYVPRLLAVAAIVKNPRYYGVHLAPIDNAPYLEQVNVGTPMALSKAANLAEVPVTTMKVLNPALQHDKLDPHGPYVLVIPKDKAETFREKLAALSNHEKQIWQKHIVQSRETLAKIAQRYRVTVTALRAANGLKSDDVVHPQETLLIPPSSPNDTNLSALASNTDKMPMDVSSNLAAQIKQNAADTDSSDTTTETQDNHSPASQAILPLATEYQVVRGDDLHRIARKFHTSVAKLRHLNKLASNHLKEGQVLKIPSNSASSKNTPALAVESHDKITGQQHVYTVRRGDYIEKVAKRFRVSTKELQQWNQLSADAILQPGQKLKIYPDTTA